MISFVRYIAVQHKFVAGSFASATPGTTPASISNALTAAGQRCFFTSAVEDDSRYSPYLDVVRRWRDVRMAGARTRPLMRAIDRVYRAASAIASGPIQRHAWARLLVREGLLKPAAILAERATRNARHGG